ncbi:uncharacterized protein BO97DRAFT_417151 [Aspergillus homomorphus CBS 101889]|uniref:Uncharacterized protein n=1 Tax=Aspergillus homomorphus (strain CBS 101889) TaxID=1450537 RepID=A0A395HQE3_ASPHC|nr:hypothetical protein BO97DRAFT_417151 [Aspergillus homomorphus CBS 101889]RAL09078.1 hypothetical protein BO97DRAFT_417151 [Aspergillus homomorphus CBS 101889]
MRWTKRTTCPMADLEPDQLASRYWAFSAPSAADSVQEALAFASLVEQEYDSILVVDTKLYTWALLLSAVDSLERQQIQRLEKHVIHRRKSRYLLGPMLNQDLVSIVQNEGSAFLKIWKGLVFAGLEQIRPMQILVYMLIPSGKHNWSPGFP